MNRTYAIPRVAESREQSGKYEAVPIKGGDE